MAARWGGGEELLYPCNMELFSSNTLDEEMGLPSDGLDDLGLDSQDSLATLQGCLDPSILSMFEDASAGEARGLDEDSEATLLTALTEILDNVDDENLSPFDMLPDSDLLSAQKGSDHSPLRRLLCLSRSPPEKDSLCSSTQACSVQRSDGEEEEGEEALAWARLSLEEEDEDDRGVGLVSLSLGELVRHMHPYCMAVCVEEGGEGEEQLLPEGGILLEVVDRGEHGEPILAIPDLLALPAAAAPSPGQPDPETADPERPEAADPDTAEPETAEPETAEPETADPETVDPETVDPERPESETAEPETADPVTGVPDEASATAEEEEEEAAPRPVARSLRSEVRAEKAVVRRPKDDTAERSPSRRKKKRKEKKEEEAATQQAALAPAGGRVLRSATAARPPPAPPAGEKRRAEKRKSTPLSPPPAVTPPPPDPRKHRRSLNAHRAGKPPSLNADRAQPAPSPPGAKLPVPAAPKPHTAAAPPPVSLETLPRPAGLLPAPPTTSAPPRPRPAEAPVAPPAPQAAPRPPADPAAARPCVVPDNRAPGTDPQPATPPSAPAPPTEARPRPLNLQQYRLLRQQKRPAPLARPDGPSTRWPSVLEPPTELTPIPCLPAPTPPRDPRHPLPRPGKREEPEEVKPAWHPQGPAAPPTPEALLVPPAYMAASSGRAVPKPAAPAPPRPSAAVAPAPGHAMPSSPSQTPPAPPGRGEPAALDVRPASLQQRALTPAPALGKGETCAPASQGAPKPATGPPSPTNAPKPATGPPSPTNAPKPATAPPSLTNVPKPATAPPSPTNAPKPSTDLPPPVYAPVRATTLPSAAAAAGPPHNPPTASPTTTAASRKVPVLKLPQSLAQAAPPLIRTGRPVKPGGPVRPGPVQSSTQELIQAFSAEIGIEAADLTSLLEQFEETQAKEKSVPEVSSRAAALGNSSVELQGPEKTAVERVRAGTTVLTPPATPPHLMWRPLAPVALLGKGRPSEGPKPSPSKTIQIDARPLPSNKLRSKAPGPAPSVDPALAWLDHDYCLPPCEPSAGDLAKRWNVKQQSSITIRTIQLPTSTSTITTTTGPAPQNPSPTPGVKTAAQPDRALDERTDRSLDERTDRALDERTDRALDERTDRALGSSVLETPDASPVRPEEEHAPPPRAPERRRSGRTPCGAASPRERKRSRSRIGRSRRRRGTQRSPSPPSSGSSSDSQCSDSDSQSRSRSPPKKRYRPRRSESSSSSSSWSSSVSRSPPRRRRRFSYSSSRSGSWSRSRSPRRPAWRRDRLRSPSCRPDYRHSSTENSPEMQRRKEKAIEERRIVYVGRIRGTMTRKELRERFSHYGEIEECTLHFRENGDNYGFVTYYDTKDAFTAIENGGKLRKPDELPFDLCFGGRRQFCRTSYADLDSNREYEPLPEKGKFDALDFDTLLKQAQKNLKR